MALRPGVQIRSSEGTVMCCLSLMLYPTTCYTPSLPSSLLCLSYVPPFPSFLPLFILLYIPFLPFLLSLPSLLSLSSFLPPTYSTFLLILLLSLLSSSPAYLIAFLFSFLLSLYLLYIFLSLPYYVYFVFLFISFSILFFLTQVILRLSLQPFFSLHYACFSPSLLSKCIFFHFSLCNLIFHLFLRVYILFLLSSSSSPVFPSIPIFLTINFSPPFLHPYLIPFPYALLQSLVLSLLLLSFIPYSLIRSVHEACVYSFVLYHYFAAVLT